MEKEQLNTFDKELLLRDLCSRLPYGVKCKYYDCHEGDYYEGTICGVERQEFIQIDGVCIHIEEVKPYLFPLSSMTDEQLYELREMFGFKIEFGNGFIDFKGRLSYLEMDALLEWFNRYHFDYRELIPNGLAIDVTKLNIY